MATRDWFCAAPASVGAEGSLDLRGKPNNLTYNLRLDAGGWRKSEGRLQCQQARRAGPATTARGKRAREIIVASQLADFSDCGDFDHCMGQKRAGQASLTPYLSQKRGYKLDFPAALNRLGYLGQRHFGRFLMCPLRLGRAQQWASGDTPVLSGAASRCGWRKNRLPVNSHREGPQVR